MAGMRRSLAIDGWTMLAGVRVCGERVRWRGWEVGQGKAKDERN